jgi:hypothetical protein
MTASDPTTEEREQELTARLKIMEQQLERLTARLGDENSGGVVNTGVNPSASATENDYPAEDIADVSEEVLNWASRNALLPRLATLCFLMVVALIFRTVTDSGIVSKLIGSALGMSYSTALIIASWYYFSKQSPLAPVFAACGAILMSTIVVETHTHFKSLPLIPAYAALVTTGIVMAIISRRFDAFTPISVGTLGMCFAGAAIDYPNPFFPYLSLVLFAANVLAYFAAQMKRCGWLRWTVLIVSMFMLQLWGFRLGSVLRRGEIPAPDLAYSWFLPVVAIFAATYFVFALCGILFRKAERISRFDASLPTINSLWAFSTAYYVVNAGGKGTLLLGGAGTVVAVTLLVLSFWLAQRSKEGSPGAGTFIFACGVLMAFALPAATGKTIFSLPIISTVAIFMAVVSRSWGSGTVRLATYLFHIYSSIALAVLLKGNDPSAMDAVNILPAGLLAVIILYQYQWCRWWPPTAEYTFFDRFDTHDRSAVLLLLGGLLSGFFTLRCAIFQVLQVIPGSLQPDVFRCSQSVLINTAVIVLIALAYIRRDKQIRNVAVFVTIVGGIKVFGYDLIGTHGLPLVFSVFSFGMAAAVESVALGKWSKKAAEQVAQDNSDVLPQA